MNNRCRQFLWHGLEENKKGGVVAWQKICKPKREGGLGLKDLKIWNKSAIGK